MANGILGLIAQPQVANVVGQFQQGQEVGRLNRLRTQAQQIGQLAPGQEQNEAIRRLGVEAPETAAQINALFQGLDAQNIRSAAFDMAAALSVGGDEQTALLEQALPKVASNPVFSQQITEMLGLPPEERTERLINAQQTFTMLDILPGREQAIARQKQEFELEKERIKATGKEKERVQKQVNTLRGDIFDINKSFRLVEEASNRIQAVGSRGTAASDLSLIFNFMKMLDPGSTVREGEFANAQNAGGVDDRIRALWNRMLEGTRLTTDQRQDFLTQARGLFDAQQQATDNQIESVLQQADQDEIDRVRVLGKEQLSAFDERRRALDRQPGELEQQQPAQPQVVLNHPTLGAVTEEDIQETMRANNMTREQVLQRLGGQ